MKEEQLIDLFKTHEMDLPAQVVSKSVRDNLRFAAEDFEYYTPETAEQTLAIRKIQEALMACNLAIAIHGVKKNRNGDLIGPY